MKRFVKEVIARLKGDNAEATGLRNHRKAEASINSQIAALNSKLVDDEAALDTAKEQLEKAKYPGTAIEDTKNYVKALAEANTQVTTCEKNIEDTKRSIKFFIAILQEFNTEEA